jgi:hypothetical protein
MIITHLLLYVYRALKEALEKEAKERQAEANQLRSIINDNAKGGAREKKN